MAMVIDDVIIFCVSSPFSSANDDPASIIYFPDMQAEVLHHCIFLLYIGLHRRRSSAVFCTRRYTTGRRMAYIVIFVHGDGR